MRQINVFQNNLVSVIIPALNAEKFIESAIASVLEQTYKNLELIIVDDGSTDSTAAVVKETMNADARIKYQYQRNSGPGNARNTGIKLSEGNLLAFLDADDLWLPSKLDISIHELLINNVDLVFTNAAVILRDIDHIYKDMGVVSNKYFGERGIISFLDQNKIPTSTVVLKKEAYLKTEGFKDVYLAEDYDLWLQLLEAGCILKSIDKPLSIYRLHRNSLTNEDRLVSFNTILVIKSFLSKNPEYVNRIRYSLRQKIKNWLYSAKDVSPDRLRILISGMKPSKHYKIFYLLSYVLPFNLLRKIINNTLLKGVF